MTLQVQVMVVLTTPDADDDDNDDQGVFSNLVPELCLQPHQQLLI